MQRRLRFRFITTRRRLTSFPILLPPVLTFTALAIQILQSTQQKLVVSWSLSSRKPAAQRNSTTLFTFQLTAKANAQASPIATKADDQKTATNIGGKLYLGAYSTADVNTATVTAVGQEFTLTNTAVTIGSAAAPELVVTEGTTGYIDEARKYVYGVAIGDEATAYFEATNGGTIEMVANDSGVKNGTGALLQLKGTDGAVLDTYTLIIFGDVNGDASVDATDSSIILQNVAGTSELTELQQFAGDVTADSVCDATDASIIMQKVAGSSDVPVNPFEA